jgi:hypothetical protein
MQNLFKDYFTLNENQVVKLKLKESKEILYGTFSIISRMYGADEIPNDDKYPSGTFEVIKDIELYKADKNSRTYDEKRHINENDVEAIEIINL